MTLTYYFRVPCLVHRSLLDLISNGKYQDDRNQNGCHESQGDLPIPAQLHAGHLVHVIGEPFVAVDVDDGHDLAEGDHGESHGAVLVEQGHPVFAGTGCANHAEGEADEASKCWGFSKS